MTISDKPSLYRLILEVRFKPTLAYFDKMVDLASSLEGYFENWEVSTNPRQVTMLSKDKNESMRAGNGILSRSIEKIVSAEAFKNAVIDLSALLLLSTDITQIDRVGARSGGLYKVDAPSDKLVDRFYEAFYADPALARNISGDSIEDAAFFLDGIKNGFRNHVRFGPMADTQVETQFGNLVTKEAKVSSPANISLDIDIFIDNAITIDNVDKLYGKIIDENFRQHQEWLAAIRDRLK